MEIYQGESYLPVFPSHMCLPGITQSHMSICANPVTSAKPYCAVISLFRILHFDRVVVGVLLVRASTTLYKSHKTGRN